MNVKDKKQVMLALIVIVFLFVFFMLLGYFYTSNRNNSKRAYVLEENYVETNNVYLNSSFPVSDALGKVYKGDADDSKQVLKEFTYKNEYSTDINYQVYLKKNSKCSGKNEIGNEFVNLYLTDSNDNALNGFTNNKLPTYLSLSVIEDLPDSKLLYSGIIKSNSSMKFKLRAWVSDLYSLGNDNKCISFDIYVRSI